MKIIIINGSPRNNGSTAYILHKIEEILISRGAEVSFINLSDQNIKLCNGCCFCYKNGYCRIKDDADVISHQIEKADGVIFGSSTIASNVTGMMKSFIDRGHFVIEQLLFNKYSLCVSTYENYGGNNTAKVLQKLITYSGANLCGTITHKLPFNSDCSENKKLNDKIKINANHLFDSIQNKKIYPVQFIKRKLIINIGLKHFILQKGNSYNAILERWKKLGLL